MENKKELYTALAQAQGEMEIAGKNKTNPFFKSSYADFTSIVCASRPALVKYGLSVMQGIEPTEDGKHHLVTILAHASGQDIQSRVKIAPPKDDVQSISSYMTYMKRMAYASLVGVVTGDDDDDGEYATQPYRTEKITADEHKQLLQEMDNNPQMIQAICKAWQVSTLQELPRNQYTAVMTKLKNLKK